MTPAERERIDNLAALEAACFHALEHGAWRITFELDAHAWLELIADARDRQPRNYSALLRDDALERLHAVIDRLHAEHLLLIAAGRGEVADRFKDGGLSG